MAITGKLQADFSAFISAIDKATIKVADMGKGASEVQGKLDRMTDNFSGRRLIQEASLMTIALEKAGGVSTLTQAELERVGAKANDAADKLKRLGYEVPPGLQKLADATKDVGKESEGAAVSFQKLVGSYLTSQAIIAGVKSAFNLVTGAISDSIKAAADAELAHNQLVAALKTQGTAIPSVVEAYGQYATALQRTTVYQDDAIEATEKTLVLVGNVMPRDMEKALKATTDLAAGLGVDLTAATLQVAKAAEGNTSALKKAGVVIDETKAQAQGFGYVLDEIEKKFGGQAEAVAGTYQGRLTQLGNTWNNVEESIGRVITQNATLLKAFDLINKSIDEQTGELKDNATATNLVSDAVLITVKSFSTLLQAFDVGQTIFTGFFITLRNLGAALGNIAITALEVTRALQFSTLSGAGIKTTQAGINALEKAVQELNNRNTAATQSSAAFGTRLQEIAYAADTVAAQLASTRGKTVEFTAAAGQSANAWDRQTEAVGKANDKLFEVNSTFGLLDGTFNQAADGITVAGDHIRTVIPVFAELQRGLDGVGDRMQPLTARVLEFSTTAIPYFNSALLSSSSTLDKWFDVLDEGLSSLPSLLQKAFTGGGGLGGAFKALSSQLGSGLFAAGGPLNALGNSLTAGALKISTKFGEALGAALPSLGALIGPAIQGLGKLFGKIFEDPEKKINPLREAFVQAAGGLDALNKKAFDAGLTLDRLLQAKNPQQYQAAIDELNKAFDRQKATVAANSASFAALFSSFATLGGALPDNIQKSVQKLIDMGKVSGDVVEQFKKLSGDGAVSFKELSDIAQRAGADLAHLGPAFESARLHDLADGIVNDFDKVARGLGSVDEALQVMKKPINDLVNESLAAGTAIPENFRPWVEQLAATGQLVDANGDKLEDISGLKFAAPIVSEFQKIVDKLQELIDKISGSGGIADAIGNIPDRTIHIGYDVEQPDFPDFGGQQQPIYAAGGYEGIVSQPTLFVAGERGSERVSIGQTGAGEMGTPQWAAELIDLMRGLPRAFRDGAQGASV